MLDMLINLAVRRRQLCLLLCVVFCGFGLHVLSRLKIEAFPDVTNVQVMVIALYPGQAAEEVEKKVTIAVERGLVGVPQALSQRSITSFGLSQVIVTFEDDTDIFFARQQIVERLPTIDVPTGVSVELGPNDTPVGQIYQYTLESDAHTATEKRGVQEWVVRNHLMRVPGVADVVSFGGFQK
jgi:cobalt-zinc-cadmium resistance protein CzcA